MVTLFATGCGDSADHAQLARALERIAALEARPTARPAPGNPDSIEVRRLVLRDAHGVERAVLETTEDGQVCLRLADEKAQPRVWLSAGSSRAGGNGSVIALMDAAGVQRVSLGAIEAGGASLLIHDSKGRGRVNLAVEVDDAPRLLLLDEAARAGVDLAMFADGASALSLAPAGQHPLLALGANPDGSALVQWLDKARNRRAALSSGPDGAPSLLLVDKNGTVRAALGSIEVPSSKSSTPDHTPASTLLLFDADGNVVKRLP
jgi:hypothetical protein